MQRHPLEISAPAGKQMKFLQPRFPQIGPAGDGPRAIFCAQSGMGKTSAAMVFVKEYLRICERVHIVSSTIELDKGYDEIKELIKKKYKDEGVDIDDPEDHPFHADLTDMKTIMAGMVKRTREAQDQGDAYAPLTLVLIDDLMSGSGAAQGYRYNDDILKLFSTSRHSGGVCLLLTQSYAMLNRSARLQATHLAIWAVQATQWTQVRDELAGRQGMSRENLEMAWQTATSKPHGFLWIAYNAPQGSTFWSGFTKKLVIK